MKKVLGIGDTIIDCLLMNNSFIKYDNGGSAYNVLYNLKKFSSDFDCFASGIIGNDSKGTALINSLYKNGIDASLIFSNAPSFFLWQACLLQIFRYILYQLYIFYCTNPYVFISDYHSILLTFKFFLNYKHILLTT